MRNSTLRFAFPILLAAQFLPIAGGVAHASGTKEGEAQFRQQCAMCHTTKSGAPAGIGPNLAGIAGRKAGSTSFKYTPAMKKSGLTWNKKQLDILLTNPSKLVPGSTMTISVANAKQRAAIVAYLMSLKP